MGWSNWTHLQFMLAFQSSDYLFFLQLVVCAVPNAPGFSTLTFHEYQMCMPSRQFNLQTHIFKHAKELVLPPFPPMDGCEERYQLNTWPNQKVAAQSLCLILFFTVHWPLASKFHGNFASTSAPFETCISGLVRYVLVVNS